MLITRISPITGKSLTLDIDINNEQIKAWEKGGIIQDIMPNITADEREFIISGLSSEEWRLVFSNFRNCSIWKAPISDR